MSYIEFERSIKQNDWSMHDLHAHSHYEIYLLTEGYRSFFLSNSLYLLQAPALIVIPPNVMHKTEGGPFKRYNINVSTAYLDAFEREVLDKKALRILQLEKNDAKKIIQLIEEGIAVNKRKKHADYILRTLFSYTVITLKECTETALSPNAVSQKNIPPLVLKVVNYLNTHFNEKITLENLANTFFVSEGTLLYNFKKYMNYSPIDFLVNIRLTKAKELLINTNKSIQEIADSCGFSSANYFGLIFKNREGLSPIAYRKNQRAKM